MRFVVCLKAEPPVRWRTHVQGLPISIEATRGTMRYGRRLPAHYGRIPRSTGLDGDALDVFLGPDLDAQEVYVCTRMTGADQPRIDEDKCMVGFASEAAARACFTAYYGPRALGGCTALPLAAFREYVQATRSPTRSGAAL